ncbi:hypothetical protein KEM48_007729 [Puccinia striiformis f. sp. tritici PST-130]|nr:hypothetical protein KEM48_007729 [Puccinia striiformis f. sp. tritici PST-130]
MGNLARPGFGATTDGTWPFSYDSCDVGAMPNQNPPQDWCTRLHGFDISQSTFLFVHDTWDNAGATLHIGTDPQEVGDLSWQPGQKLSRCTCAAEDHPGPKMSDGTYKGRSSPEIDMVEAYSWEKSATSFGSQSLQIAPYDDKRIAQRTASTPNQDSGQTSILITVAIVNKLYPLLRLCHNPIVV